jgi:hypothetical protein
MNHSRSGRPKNPGRMVRQTVVVSTWRCRVVERWASQPRTTNHATPWVRKRRFPSPSMMNQW